MQVLMLTWEYPPFIVGGLGVACYGLFKALTERGIKIYMILPTEERVFFEITNPFEADFPVAKYWDKKQIKPIPLKFYQFKYLEPEGGYVSIKEMIPWDLNFHSEVKPEHKIKEITHVPQWVLERTLELLNRENHLITKVKKYTQNVLEIAKYLEFDLIHAHDWLTYPAGLLLKSSYKKPLISHIHATEFDRAIGYGHPIIHEIEYLGLNFADIVIAVSNYTADIVKEHYFVPPEKIRIVYNAFTTFTQEPKKIRKFKCPVILFLGRLTPQKGPRIFLEIAKKVLRTYPREVKFMIAGTGEMERELMLEAASEGVGTYILFTGFLTRSEVEEALSMADIVVMPSVSEPFGIVALEAMYFGCALIISKQSGASEILKNVFRVDFWDVDRIVEILIDLLENPSKLKEIQERGKVEVENIRWEDRANEVIKIYKEFVG